MAFPNYFSILTVFFKSRVGLKKARLGDEQLRAILSCSLGRTRFLFSTTFIAQDFFFHNFHHFSFSVRLRQIDLSGVNLSAVPGDLLALVNKTRISSLNLC